MITPFTEAFDDITKKFQDKDPIKETPSQAFNQDKKGKSDMDKAKGKASEEEQKTKDRKLMRSKLSSALQGGGSVTPEDLVVFRRKEVASFLSKYEDVANGLTAFGPDHSLSVSNKAGQQVPFPSPNTATASQLRSYIMSVVTGGDSKSKRFLAEVLENWVDKEDPTSYVPPEKSKAQRDREFERNKHKL